MSKKQIIVNEWEKLTALSNRRLNVKGIDTPLKLSWSIDRITIVGKLKETIYYHTENDVLFL
ncbi:replication initiation factor domain-containing protein, partial [Enterococcus faecalis]